MKIFCIMTLARQINGEYVFLRSEKAFLDENKANNYLNKLKQSYAKDGKPVGVEIKTESGSAVCICETGVFEMEIEQ